MYISKMAKIVGPAMDKCDKLSDRERYVLDRWYGLHGVERETDSKIARSLGVAFTRVHHIKSNAITKLLHFVPGFKEEYEKVFGL